MSHDADMTGRRIDHIRWVILLCLNEARPSSCSEHLIHLGVRGDVEDVRPDEIRRELDFLEKDGCVTIDRSDTLPRWLVTLTVRGINVSTWKVECPPGIGRPRKYF